MDRGLFLTVVSLLFLGFVSGSSAFDVYTDVADLNLCSCQVYQNDFIIQNTDYSPQQFYIALGDDASLYSALAQPVIYVSEYGTETFSQFLDIPCDFTGQFDNRLYVESDSGELKQLVQTVHASTCLNNQVSFYANNYTASLCEPFVVDFRVTNAGPYSDTFVFESSPYSDSVLFSEPAVVLQSGESRTIKAQINLGCNVYGYQLLNINTIAQKTNQRSNGQILVYVEPEYDFDVSVSVAETCNLEPVKTTIELANNNDFENTFFIKNSLTSDVSNITLLSHDSGSIDYELNSELLGSTSVSFVVSALNGPIHKTVDVDLPIQNCYDVSFDVQTTKITTYCNETKQLTVNNKGIKDITFDVTSNSNTWVPLTQSYFVESDESATVDLISTIACSKDSSDEVTLNLIYANKTLDLLNFVVDHNTQQDYFKPLSLAAEYSVSKETEIHYFLFKNPSPSQKTYDVTVNSSLITLDIDKITVGSNDDFFVPFFVNTSLERGTYDLDLYFYIDGNTYAVTETIHVDKQHLIQQLSDKFKQFLFLNARFISFTIFAFLLAVLIIAILKQMKSESHDEEAVHQPKKRVKK